MPKNKLPDISQKARVPVAYDIKRRRQYSHRCILGISPTNLKFQGESFFAILLGIRDAGFKSLRMGLADTLQRFNFERQGMEPEAAYKASKELGDAWCSKLTFRLGDSEGRYTHQQMIEMVFPKGCEVDVTFERWDELRFESTESATESTSSDPMSSGAKASPTFAEIEAIVRRAHSANDGVNSFADKVELAAFELLRDRTGVPTTTLTRTEQLPYVINYILEEIAMQVLWGLRYPCSIAPYPVGVGGAVLKLIQEAVNILLDTERELLSGCELHFSDIYVDPKGKLAASSSRSPSPPSARQEPQAPGQSLLPLPESLGLLSGPTESKPVSPGLPVSNSLAISLLPSLHESELSAQELYSYEAQARLSGSGDSSPSSSLSLSPSSSEEVSPLTSPKSDSPMTASPTFFAKTSPSRSNIPLHQDSERREVMDTSKTLEDLLYMVSIASPGESAQWYAIALRIRVEQLKAAQQQIETPKVPTIGRSLSQ